MKFLVTGGCGFIGSHLVESLVNDGHTVVVIDNLHSGSETNLKGIKIDKLIRNDCRSVEVDGAISDIDGIFHLGIYSSSPMYKEDQTLVWKSIYDFQKMLFFAEWSNVKMVYASTSSIYNGNLIPWNEDYYIFVRDYYSEARYYMERLARLHCQTKGTNAIGLRLFSVYGPREESKGKYANLISQFGWDIRDNIKPVVYGDGDQRRDFIYVDDVVNAFRLAFKSKVECDVINVGTGIMKNLNEIVEILNDVIGKDIKPRYIPNKIENYIFSTLADTRKAYKKIGFKSGITVREGIEKIFGER